MTRIEPDEGTFTLHFSHPLFPGGKFRMDFPEGYGASRMPLYLGLNRSELPLRWEPTDDGGFSQTVTKEHSHSYTVRITPVADGALLSAAFTNLATMDLMGLTFNPCIMTAEVPGLPDPQCRRTFVWTSEGIRCIRETRRCLQRESFGTRQFYVMPFARRGDAGGFGNAGWGTSPDLIRVPLAAKAADDNSRSAATIWRNAFATAFNWDDTHHCMHSVPYIGFLDAGETKLLEGKIYLIEGGVEKLAEKVKEDFPSLFYEDPTPPDPNWAMCD